MWVVGSEDLKGCNDVWGGTDPAAIVSAEESRKPLPARPIPRTKCNAVRPRLCVRKDVGCGADNEESRRREVTQHKRGFWHFLLEVLRIDRFWAPRLASPCWQITDRESIHGRLGGLGVCSVDKSNKCLTCKHRGVSC